MKILLYTGVLKAIEKSGLGKAIEHQKKALEDNNIEYTTNLKDDFDVLHINFYDPKSYWFAKKMRKKGKKIVYHAHSTEEDFRNSFLFSNLVSSLFKKWLIKCYKLGDCIITPTEYSKRLLSNYGLDKPIVAISNGIDTKFFKKNKANGKVFRETYGYTSEDKVIVGIGLYIERKGILDFVELAKRLPQYQFIWFGYSPLAASPRKIKEAVNTKLPNLKFAGYVKQDMIRNALSGADLYLFPTLEETEGIPILEALCSKTPTLVRDIPVFEEYEENRVVYKAKNIDEFEKKTVDILSKKLPDLSKDGYEFAKGKDIDIVGKQMVEVYKKTLKETRKDNVKNKFSYKLLSIFVATILLILAILNLDMPSILSKKEYKMTFESMDREITITLYSYNEDLADKAFSDIKDIYNKYDKLSSRKVHGDIYDIYHNDSDDNKYKIDKDLYEMLEYGLAWKDKSDGLLNINIGNLTDLWNSYRVNNKVPSVEEINSLSILELELLDDYYIANNHVNLDLDFMKYGYSTLKVKEYLEQQHIKNYMIQMGDLIVAGDNPKEEKYKIGLASPFLNNDNLVQIIRINNISVASTNLYQEYFIFQDKIYGKYINPITKYPADNMVGVTVLNDNPADSQMLARMLFYMDIEDSIEYVNDHEGIEAIWYYLDEDGNEQITRSDHFSKYE